MTRPTRCKRCGHTEAYTGLLLDGICGSCGDDLRQERQAEEMEDLMLTDDEIRAAQMDAMAERIYAVEEVTLSGRPTGPYTVEEV